MSAVKATRVFVPNAAYVPGDAVTTDRQGRHADPELCTPLYIYGDRQQGYVYTQKAWEQHGEPSYRLMDENYYRVLPSGTLEFFCKAGLSLQQRSLHDLQGGEYIVLLPEMWCVKEDETYYWSDPLRYKFRVKRFFGVYVLNRCKHVHLCEITPSYERVFFRTQYELQDGVELTEAERDELEEEIRRGDAETEEYSYEHCRIADACLTTVIKPGEFPPAGKSGGYRITGLVSVFEDDALEEIREWLCNNEL